MPAGRPRQPIERARLTGRTSSTDSGGRKLPEIQGVIAKTVDVPDLPERIGRKGAEQWERIWTSGTWLAPEQDYHWVSMIAKAYDQIEAFEAEIARDGLTSRGSMGQMVAHPLIAEIRRANQEIQKCLSLLGFSPSDRARLGLAEIKKQDALLDFLNKKGRS